jgi:beta-hydroxyacyl-ACP dehydratase FabZ
VLNVEDIQKILPHRHPFLLVDRIIELRDGESAVGVKAVSYNEPFFRGHFPDHPVMPGVLVVEAMAQVGAVLLLSGLPEERRRIVYFTGIDKTRFRRPVRPGDQLRLELKVLKLRSRTAKMRGEAYVDGTLVAEAEIFSALVEEGQS